jgi:hypothetical protein
MEIEKFLLCCGTMVKGKSKESGYTVYFWKKPWSGILGGVILAYPWLCLDITEL